MKNYTKQINLKVSKEQLEMIKTIQAEKAALYPEQLYSMSDAIRDAVEQAYKEVKKE